MHKREQEVQQKREEDVKEQPQQWKMRRFQSVESKLRGQGLGPGGAPSQHEAATPQEAAPAQQRKMTKAEQMKLRMQQERAEGGGGAAAANAGGAGAGI